MQEINPFTDRKVAKEWIASIEGEHRKIRDNELYPCLEKWAEEISPQLLIDIGSGQGICADHVQFCGTHYIGIEPSSYLVERAKEKYARDNREFIVGDAYRLPIEDNKVDAVLSVNVWFHLRDIDCASKELSRVLKPNGKFLVSTANPTSYDIWRKMYFEAVEDEEKIDGKVKVAVNPMTRNVFYKHTNESIRRAFEQNGLKIEREEDIGFCGEMRPMFINYFGFKV